MRYQFTVTFTRNLGDDLEIAQLRYPKITDEREALLQQLRVELQQSYDDGVIAGEFNIDRESFLKL